MFDKQIPNMLLGDPLRITQILLNLANNAIKFTESGEVIVRLRLKSRIDNMVNLVFEVEDTGIGMTPKQVNKLFSPFAQADVSTTRKYGGTGLGLVISKNLVEMMKGTMELKSEYGKGSTFFFELPFQVSNKKQDEKAVPVEFSNLKALVVDDNYTARLILRNYLEDFNFTVDVASSGYDAVDMIDASYNLVLLDWKMPGMDGIQAWDKIKQKMSDETPNVIMVIAYDKSELNLSENSGIDTMLMKPVNPSTLFNAIIYELGMDAVSSSKKSEIDTVEGMESIRGARILVVDDNMINQQIAKETLENEEFWIILADNGQIACDILNSRDDIDIVLMDLQMPVLDGYQATEKIRAEISKTIPIIALSADAMKGTRERAQSIGMNSYVTKLIDFKILYTIMVEYIKGDGFKLNETQQLETVTDNEREEYLIKALPTFDMVRNLSLFSNKESFLLDILGKFKEDYNDIEKTIRDIIKSSGDGDIHRVLHTLKGVAGNIGANEIYQLTADIEDEIHGVTDIQLSALFEALFEKIRISIDEISKLELNHKEEYDKIIAYKKVNEETFAEVFDTLGDSIDNYDVEAEENINVIRGNLIHLGYVQQVDMMIKALGDYEFDLALEVYNQIAEKMNCGDEISDL